MSKAIGARIRAHRDANGLTADALGQQVGRDRQAVYSWEQGRTAPNPAALFVLADLGIISMDERDQLIRGRAA